jgi:hypothetical protein
MTTNEKQRFVDDAGRCWVAISSASLHDAQNGRGLRILQLGPAGGAQPLRHDALQPQLASVVENGMAWPGEVLAQTDAGLSLTQ